MNPLKKQVHIYILEDPTTGSVRYVGQSVSPSRRLQSHLSPSHLRISNYKNNWIRSLVETGRRPIMTIIETCSFEDADEVEAFYISYFKYIGFNLANLAEFGHVSRKPKTGLKAKGVPATGKNARGLRRDFIKVPVIGTNLETGETKLYNHIKDVALDGFIPASVSSVLRGKTLSHKGYNWKYPEGFVPRRWKKTAGKVFPRRKFAVRKIVGIDLGTNQRLEFKSAYQAAKHICVYHTCRRYIHEVCKGERSSYKNWKFSYLE